MPDFVEDPIDDFDHAKAARRGYGYGRGRGGGGGCMMPVLVLVALAGAALLVWWLY